MSLKPEIDLFTERSIFFAEADLFAKKLRQEPDNPCFFGQTALTRNEDLVLLDDDVSLPHGMAIKDLWDALNKARLYEKQDISFSLFVKKRVEYNGVLHGGLSWPKARKDFKPCFILVSTENADKIAGSRSGIAGYIAAPASYQLWASVFEEAFHYAREAADVSEDEYFMPPSNPTALDFVRYVRQEEEIAVENALNNGILEDKFGLGTISFMKRILIPAPRADSTQSS